MLFLNRKRSFKIFRKILFVIHSEAQKLFIRQVMKKLERTAEFLASYIKEATGLTVQCTTENKRE